jgi:hypothetical protein
VIVAPSGKESSRGPSFFARRTAVVTKEKNKETIRTRRAEYLIDLFDLEKS